MRGLALSLVVVALLPGCAELFGVKVTLRPTDAAWTHPVDLFGHADEREWRWADDDVEVTVLEVRANDGGGTPRRAEEAGTVFVTDRRGRIVRVTLHAEGLPEGSEIGRAESLRPRWSKPLHDGDVFEQVRPSEEPSGSDPRAAAILGELHQGLPILVLRPTRTDAGDTQVGDVVRCTLRIEKPDGSVVVCPLAFDVANVRPWWPYPLFFLLPLHWVFGALAAG